MASVMLEQPEAHKDCNLWHPLHIVMRPSSVICYKKNNNNITSHNSAGGGAKALLVLLLRLPTRHVPEAELCFF